MSVRQGYLLGIGSNIDPERNTLLIVERLRRRFGEILVSRIIQTDPVGMSSQRPFSNFCAFVETKLEPQACKAACVAIEVELIEHALDQLADWFVAADLEVKLPRRLFAGAPVVFASSSHDVMRMVELPHTAQALARSGQRRDADLVSVPRSVWPPLRR